MFKEDNLQQHRQHIIKNLRSNQLPRALMMTRSIIILKNLRHYSVLCRRLEKVVADLLDIASGMD